MQVLLDQRPCGAFTVEQQVDAVGDRGIARSREPARTQRDRQDRPSRAKLLIPLAGHLARLILRRWRETDLAPFAALNADQQVMRFMPSVMTAEETRALIARIEEHFRAHGFGIWAVEAAGVAPFVGFVGLQRVGFEAHFTPAVEIGWRLAPAHWGKGYATEAARAALRGEGAGRSAERRHRAD